MTTARNTRGRLFRKYVVIFTALVGGALLVSGATNLFFFYRDTRDARVEVQREKVAAAAAAIDQFIGEIERRIRGVTQQPAGAGADVLRQRRLDYHRLLNHVPAITEVAHYDPAGREELRVSRLSPDVVGSRVDHSADRAFVGARSRDAHFGPVYFRAESEPYMTIAVREAGPGDGPRAGLAVAEVNLRFVWDVVSRIRVGKVGYAYVVDSSGIVVAHPDNSVVLRKTDLSAVAHVREALAASRSATDRAAASFAEGPRGQPVLTTWQAIDRLGWLVFVEQPRAEAFAPVYGAVLRTTVFLVVGLLLAVAASLVLARRMVAPVKALQASATRIGAGALDETIDLRTGDDLEALGREFNRMTARLRESYATLEQKVEERTRELAAALQQLEEANRHKSQFLANMSHELRTPLNAVIGFSEVLQQRIFGDLNEKQLDYLQDILTSGRHLLSLINDILDLSKVEAGRMELQLGAVSVRDVLDNGLRMIRERASNHGIALKLDADPDVGVIEADERKLKQILFNLLSNAIKFTPDGGHVEVRARLVGDKVQVAVRDDGVGIAPSDQERIFEEFHQLRGGGRDEGGTGLGLSLAKRFVELHGGRIWVESAPGAGSTFTFALPARRPGVAAAPMPVADQPAEPSREIGRPTVLLIEDDRYAADLLAAYLDGADVDLVVRRDGEAGLEAARRLRPALIILDIMLPQMDGWEVLARVKEDPATMDIPVVVVSILDEPGKGFGLGASDYLIKPLGREPLLHALDRFIRRHPAVDGGVKVLAIDDDPIAINLVEAVLGPAGYDVLRALSGEEGLRLARAEQPALVILDLLMPGMDGLDVVDHMRADPATAHIPIIVLTSKSISDADKKRLNDHVSFLAHKSEFQRGAFVELVQRFCHPGRAS
ncbi:MAG: response regulator [Gemmatimonadaceae bacterium]